MSLMISLALAGSSPHTRGALSRTASRVSLHGIIPAYAGSTCASMRLVLLLKDHPRIRGEHDLMAIAEETFEGSSPHTRGALRRSFRRSCKLRDHPRIRGEHCRIFRLVCIAVGSSPHTRGAPVRVDPRHLLSGIIPAYAGSTVHVPSRRLNDRDHPRIRGEHHLSCECQLLLLGSSPHTRGARRSA